MFDKLFYFNKVDCYKMSRVNSQINTQITTVTLNTTGLAHAGVSASNLDSCVCSGWITARRID